MKVLHVLRCSESAYGVERTVLSILPGLVERGCGVHVLVVVETRVGGLSGRLLDALRQAGCGVELVETARRVPFGVARRIRALCEQDGIDVIHSHGYKCNVASLLSRRSARRVATVHGWCSRSRRERFYEWIDVQCLKRMDCVVALCEAYRGRLEQRGVLADRIRVAHAGVDPDTLPASGRDYRAAWGIGPDDVLVAQVGRLSPEKNPLLLIRVAERLCERRPGVRFVLVGEGKMRDRLEAEPAVRDGRVRLAGYASDVGDVFRATDVVVNCSTTEGLPGALLEAGATGTPAVATGVGGAAEIVDDGATGFVCPSGDADAIAAAVERLATDPDLRNRMGAAARERVAAVFGTGAAAARLIEIYDELVG